ncbi:MAG: protein-L-isoaspartate carboxylmethyltransferase [Microbacterium sp.]|uniref:protein-L-isoaspartate carboxylmethyltransferase n=1 Tax=Microbacterium sp. TaxID=51671 RepID=UPI001AC205BD|nr:protein-L-isoaspartate carboxylmethyltransferase [Microbacterium sp.]MBN9176543.1 protein-L-isoaspartate carboxylmethyltransferase [Microbacterium sp.]
MPYRNKATVQSWVDDYLSSHPSESIVVTVLEKDFTPGPESGMVVVSLRNASTVTYIQAVVDDRGPHWVVTFEPRSDAFDLDAASVARLSADLAELAGICAYLQERTEQAMVAGAASASL